MASFTEDTNEYAVSLNTMIQMKTQNIRMKELKFEEVRGQLSELSRRKMIGTSKFSVVGWLTGKSAKSNKVSQS